MKVEMNFDGKSLRLRLVVEDETERALAALMESYSSAEIYVQREGNDYGYSYERDRKVQAINVTLTKPPLKMTSDD